MGGGSATRRLLVIGLGTMAFSMGDVLLEPYGGQILHLAVNPAPLSSLPKLPLLTNK